MKEPKFNSWICQVTLLRSKKITFDLGIIEGASQGKGKIS
jgi:hypothetical protein